MSDKRKLAEAMFDEAMRLRDGEDLLGARRLLVQLIETIELVQFTDKYGNNLLGHCYMQLGLIAELRGEQKERELQFETAVKILPRSDLASIARFHALFAGARFREAFAEMVRLLRIRYSPRYAEMLDAPGYLEGITNEELSALCREAMQLLEKRRPAYPKAVETVAKRRPN